MHSLSGLKKWIKQSKKNTFKIKHLRWYFKGGRRETAEELSPEEQGFYYRANRRTARLNRLVMRNILIDSTREQIINNKQVKEKQSYLNASKIYSFRCCNRVLASRMQTN